MRSKEFITELFQSPYPYEITVDSDSRIQYSFKTENAEYENIFYEETAEEGSNRSDWEFMFTATVYNSKHIRTTRLTKSGNSLRVMATVFAIIINFFDRVRPTSLSFSANLHDPSRSRLYSHLINRFSPELAKMKYKTDISKSGSFMDYTIYRP